jgi:TRAP-type C4-dicarboxylate transport system substrate-binding protein
MKRKVFHMLLLLALVLLIPSAPEAKMTLKLATVTPPHHAYALGAKEFARFVEEATKGEIIIKVFPGGQLGKGERELLEGMQIGTIDMAVTATGPVSNFCENMGVVDLESAKIKGLAFFENGFRNFTNSKRALVKPADFKGLKFRTMENPVHLESVRQLGAQAVPMSWGEVYTSLQTHVIDGQENPIAIVHSYKLNEVQKYLSLTWHFYSPAPLTMSLKKFNELKAEHRKLFLDGALKAAAFERKLIRDNEAKQLVELKAQGMVVSVVDKNTFVEAMAPVYAKFFEKYPGWKGIVEKIRATR